MNWKCPQCGSEDNDESSLRCTCGWDLQNNQVSNEDRDRLKHDYQKIGGALILVAIWLAINIILSGYYIAIMVTEPVSERLDILLRAIVAFFYIGIPIILLLLLYNKKRIFIKLSLIYFILSLSLFLFAMFIFRSLVVQSMPSFTAQVITYCFSYITLIVYLLMSDRVKRTLTK